MKSKFLTVAAALAIASSVAVTVPSDPSARADAQRGRMPGRAAMAYVARAGAADLYEIQSSQLAAARARRPQVRDFAQMLVTDHTRTTQLVTQAAQDDGLRPPPPALEPAQRTMLRQLERARPADFERLYLSQQITAHQQALALHRNQARSGDGGALRRVAASAVPIVQGHLTRARQLARAR
jgi:putative membrane protein